MRQRYLPIIAFLAIPLAGPAQADARGDVLAGFSRCAGITDDRTWLDCIYGAAQPMRAQLGLPPALAAQTRLVPPAIPGAPPVHLVAEGAELPVMPEKQKPGLVRFLVGDFEHPLVSNIAMTSYGFRSNGMFTVTLANGQVWEQVGDPDISSLAHWQGPASRLAVNITPGALNTYNLVVTSERSLYKVQRLR